MKRTISILSVAGALTVMAGCDYTGDWLFPDQVEGYPYIIDLGELEVFSVGYDIDDRSVPDEQLQQSYNDMIDSTRFMMIGASGGYEKAGATFTFTGTGGDICIFVDPELVYWNQAVSGLSPEKRYAYPDNPFDDGDVDITAGQSLYYTGTPGQELGDFIVNYRDSMGNTVPLELNECNQKGLGGIDGAHSGRGAPEYCTISTTSGVSYTGVAYVWSTPLDDDVVSAGLLLVSAEDGCGDVLQLAGIDSGDDQTREDECLIQGETIDNDSVNWIGEPLTADDFETVTNAFGVSSIELEDAFCASQRTALPNFCEAEGTEIISNGGSWVEYCAEQGNRCFCGDLTDTPAGGAY